MRRAPKSAPLRGVPLRVAANREVPTARAARLPCAAGLGQYRPRGFAMHFFSVLSQNESTTAAVEDLIARAKEATNGKIDVAFVFLTAHHKEEADAIAEKLWLELDPQALLGVTAEGVIGEDLEVERSPGISLLVGDMPGVRLHPFHIPVADWRSLIQEPQVLAERFGYTEETRAIIAFGDPFTTPVTQLLDLMNQSMHNAPLIGGMASGSQTRGGNALIKNDCVYNGGMVGISLTGNVQVQSIVSQGCRPIGQSMVITKSHDNVIEQLGGRPSLKALRELIQGLPAEDQELINTHGLMIGRVISEYKDRFTRGDFLVRGLSGADENSGAIAVGDYVKTGQTVQFHVRDAATADEDLNLMLDPQNLGDPPAAALLFSCNGRGLNMFEKPSHDVTAAKAAMPRTAVAGFFAAGELGPVGGKNFIHGHTASLALLRPRD
jgi:small ligand-binding sensory domain FIST